MCDVLDKVENRGIEKGIVKGESRGENKMALLVKKLLDQNRIDGVKRASEDEKSRAVDYFQNSCYSVSITL